MKLKDIFSDIATKVFVVTNQDNDNELNWSIEPTDFNLLPEEENIYFVKALQVSADKTQDCFMGIMTPERIAEKVIKKSKNGETIIQSIYDQEKTVIPAIASDCFGDYELYYAKENPQLGINVLKDGLNKSKEKTAIAEDLGYILRDEGRFEEAVEAFKISEETTPSSEFIYQEISQLYGRLGLKEKEVEYQDKFEASSK